MIAYFTQAWRSWRGAKAPAALAILTLAAGIGATTTIFTIVNGLMLQPVPYDGGDRWVSLYGGDPRDPDSRSSLSAPDMVRYRQSTSAFDFVAILAFQSANLTAPGAPQRVEIVESTADAVNALGIQPRIGKWFSGNEVEAVAVISHALWQRLGSDPAIAGKGITLQGRPYSVVGVMPPGFRFPLATYAGDVRIDVWLPLDRKAFETAQARAYFGIARRRGGVTMQAAQADAARVASQIAKDDPVTHPNYTARVDSMLEIILKEIRPTLLLVFAAAGVLLLITCANVASVMVARSVERVRETALRVALGAGTMQMAIQHLCEGMLLAAAGAMGGLAAAHLLLRFAVQQHAVNYPSLERLVIDGRVLLFTVGTASLATILPSLAPLWQALRTSPAEALNEGVRASSGARSRKLAQVLVVLEIALSFVLLAGGFALVSRLRSLQRTAPGFTIDNLVTFELSGERQHNRGPFYLRLVEALQSIPGVSSAALSSQIPLGGCCFVTPIFPRGSGADYRAETASLMLVTPGYFTTMGIAIRKGRLLAETDMPKDAIPVVINEAAAKLYWPGVEPVGAAGRIGAKDGSPVTVIGVIGDVKNKGLGQPATPEVYLHAAIAVMNPIHATLRTSLPSSVLASQITKAVQSADKDLPVTGLTTMRDVARESMAQDRIASWVTGFFAIAALVMSALGIYGVVSYSARQRTVEIGTRMALGAQASDVLRMVLASGWKMALGGVLLGSAGYAAIVPVLRQAVDISDAGILPALVALVVVTLVTLTASFFPAWRATLISPLVSIRGESGSILETGKELLRTAPSRHDPVLASELSAGFVKASREANSFHEALGLMLQMLCERTGARWALLLEPSGREALVQAASHGGVQLQLSAAGFLIRRMRSRSAALPFDDADWDAFERWAAAQRPDHSREIGLLREANLRLALPLHAKQETLGVLLLGPLPEDRAYEPATRSALEESAVPLALMLENLRLTGRIVEQEKAAAELEIAAEVQRRLLPQRVPISSAATLAAVTMPARSVGGDSYDFLTRPGELGFAIADVAGKGVAAALLTSMVQASLRLIAAEDGIALPMTVTRMNRFLKQTFAGNRGSFATFFYAKLNETTRELRYVNAGHNPPYLLREGKEETLPRTGLVIGMFDKALYEERSLSLRQGDLLFVFTDGLTEARNASGEDFGEERLVDLLKNCAAEPADAVAAHVSEGVKLWMGETPAHDDITFLVMKVS
ncbi:MAG: SpoIIE family protein phosphatase [Acidobacteria bacterium]|nr:SpoIIE family protein phosphatase [Acidobacteriota bacterium]